MPKLGMYCVGILVTWVTQDPMGFGTRGYIGTCIHGALCGGDCFRSILEFQDLSTWHDVGQEVVYGTTSLVFGDWALIGNDPHLQLSPL